MLLTAFALIAVEKPPAPDNCAVLARLIAAARERPAFDSIRQALARSETIVPGFSAADCRVADDALVCSHRRPEEGGFLEERGMVSCPGLTAIRHGLTQYSRTLAVDGSDGLQVSYGRRCLHCAAPGRPWLRIGRPVRRTAPSAP